MVRSSYRPVLKGPVGGTRYRQIADALVHDIRRGALPVGARLPGTRPLAAALGVHRNTVVAAIDALTSEGWLEARAGSGTFVAEGAGEGEASRDASGRRLLTRGARAPLGQEAGFAWQARVRHPERSLADAREPGGRIIPLASGAPDPRLIPAELLARAWRRALRARGGALLDYGDPFGHPPLRAALAQFLGERRGIACSPEHIVIVRGSQMGLALAAELLPRGGRIGVEALGYRPAWEAFGLAGLQVVPVPVDADGLVCDALAAGLAGVYVTPHHQYPTGVVLSGPRRAQLLTHARAARLAIFEDDYDHEFHFEGAPRRPLAADDAHGQVVYIGTLSKILAPGLRLGFVVAPARIAAAIAARRVALDRQDDAVLSAAVTELIEDGSLVRHVRRLRRTFAERRELLFGALRARLGDALTWTPAPGGLALWARADEGIDVGRWAQDALAAGVAVAEGRAFQWDPNGAARQYLRIGFGRCDAGEIATGIQRLARALKTQRAQRAPARRR